MSSSGPGAVRRGLVGRARTVAFLLVVLTVAGCGSSDETAASGGAPSAARPRLLLYCGAGIRPAAVEIVKAFEQTHGVTIECDYDGSERLLARMKLSGLGDVYMPGDIQYVEQAVGQGLVTTHKNACYFIPVILVQKGNPKKVRSLADLTGPGIDLGLGNPEVCAVGRKSLKLFEKNGISPEDIQKNLRFQAMTVNDLGTHIKLGQLDAVIVWDAMAAYFADAGDVVQIPLEDNVISTVAAGVLKSSKQPELASKLVDFIASNEGKAIFRNHHYTTEIQE